MPVYDFKIQSSSKKPITHTQSKVVITICIITLLAWPTFAVRAGLLQGSWLGIRVLSNAPPTAGTHVTRTSHNCDAKAYCELHIKVSKPHI